MKMWIARDLNGDLYLYNQFPVLSYHTSSFVALDKYLKLDSDLFPEVTFENSPRDVEIKLLKEK